MQDTHTKLDNDIVTRNQRDKDHIHNIQPVLQNTNRNIKNKRLRTPPRKQFNVPGHYNEPQID
uniref:Uncharacterized protein n=1 Tax=Arion vulgaris TaxID=1028688 RepID=A0A0B7B7Y7_9EUPU